jgi:hypothetical protein
MTAVDEFECSRRPRRAVAAWILIVGGASVVDPAVVLGTAASGSMGPLTLLGIDAFVASHLIAYGVLGWLLVAVFDSDTDVRHSVIVAIVVATAVGVGIEFLQAPLSTRTASTADALINAAGAVVGAGLGGAGRRR